MSCCGKKIILKVAIPSIAKQAKVNPLAVKRDKPPLKTVKAYKANNSEKYRV